MCRQAWPAIKRESICFHGALPQLDSLLKNDAVVCCGSLEGLGTLPRYGSLLDLGTLVSHGSFCTTVTFALYDSLLVSVTFQRGGSFRGFGTIRGHGSHNRHVTIAGLGSLIGVGAGLQFDSILNIGTHSMDVSL